MNIFLIIVLYKYLNYFKQLIGRNISQLFRKEVKIDNLPRIEVAGKQVVRVDDISNNAKDTGLTALFAGPT